MVKLLKTEDENQSDIHKNKVKMFYEAISQNL